jgi:hypothetical protein
VGLKSLKSLNLTNGYPNNKNKKKKNNKVKSKPLELFELAGKNLTLDVKKSNSSNETPIVMTVGVENYGLSAVAAHAIPSKLYAFVATRHAHAAP